MKKQKYDINSYLKELNIIPKGIGIPEELIEIAIECSSDISNSDVWEQVGEGSAGIVYTRPDYEYAVKIQKVSRLFKAEMKALTDLQPILLKEKGVVPKLYASWIFDGNGYLLIEKLRDCYGMKSKEMEYALKKIEEYGWLHLDISVCNRMTNREGKLVIIDFGWAVKKPSDDKKTYPNHPISIKLCKPFTYAELKIRQDSDFEMIYSKYLDEKEEEDIQMYIPKKPSHRPITKTDSSCIII
jgi:serine/threonine protein kinase